MADTRPLGTPAFRRLWLAGIVTSVGAQLSVVAVPVQVFALTRSSVYVGLTGLFGLVPLVVFGLWGGAIADAMDRRTLLMITGLGLALTALGLGAVAITGVGTVWLVLSLYAVQQAFLAVNQPTRGAVLPRLLPAGELPAANALNMLVMMFGAIVGPLLAGALLPLIGLGTLYLLDAVALTATLWATWRLPAIPPIPTGDAGSGETTGGAAPRRAGLREVLAGFVFLARQKVLLVSFLVDIIAMGFGLPRAVFPEMAVRTFGDPPSGGHALGWLYAAMAIGAAAGGLFSGWLHGVRRQGVAVTVAICVWGLGVAAFGLTHVLWLAVLFLAVGGAADLVSAVFRSTMLQVVATDEMRGRMQGVFIVVVVGGPRLADVWHGPAAAAFGTSAAATAGGLAVVVLTVAVVARYREFWRYRAL
ncbi:MAG TPA: MFS transporter [Pseudonocardiaceae bacterium]